AASTSALPGDGSGILLALSGPSATATENVVLVLGTGGDGRSPGARLAFYPNAAIVPWNASRGRALLTYEAAPQTHFLVLDARGHPGGPRAIAGTALTCRARADLLACLYADKNVRVWRLPAYALP